jgi:hypothetical protein
MAIVAYFHETGMTRDDYEQLRAKVGWEHNKPAGVQLHIASFDADGALHVVDVWDSPEQLMSFFQERLSPVFAELGVTPAPPQVHPVHNLNAHPALDAHRI